MGTNPDAYVLGHSTEEQRRLDAQGRTLRPFTERLLQAAGINRGMRVLDVGCGTGDVALLAADLVGAEGHVVGVDRASAVLETAASRVSARGWEHVTFVQDDIGMMAIDRPVNAVVGRLVLLYQPDPAETLRHLATLVVPGGTLAFLEMVMVPGLPAPGRPLFAQVYRLIATAFERSGTHPDMGLRLAASFHNADLPDPDTHIDPVTIVGPDPAWLGMYAGVLRSLLPTIERLGLATAEEITIDSLLDRMLAEAMGANTAVAGPAYVGAWSRTPRSR